jgi:O-antigen/teichoic acid export membrane protein
MELRYYKGKFEMPLINSYIKNGRYTVGTMISGSLLRNSDTFMIAALLNTPAVVTYTIAQKFIEIFETVLRSAASSSFPSLYLIRENKKLFSRKLARINSLLMAGFIPAAIIVFIFSSDIVHMFSGTADYTISSNLLKIFMPFVILLPADRLIGVALEAHDLSRSNFKKTLLLCLVNVTGNYIALTYFHSLLLVAVVSSIALIISIGSGLIMLKDKITPVPVKEIVQLNPIN